MLTNFAPAEKSSRDFAFRIHMAARTRKIRHDDETREKIRASQLINRLEDHVFGSCELSATQVTAALGLLRKRIPDLTAVNHSGEVATKRSTELSDDELAHIAARGSESAASTTVNPQKLN